MTKVNRFAPRPPTTMDELSKNATYVGLFQMADRLNDRFGDQIPKPIGYMTPFGWWKYTKADTISLPMPQPRAIITDKGGHPTPIWRWLEITKWYAGYAGLALNGDQ